MTPSDEHPEGTEPRADRVLPILAPLSTHAREKRGWQRRGVRGWAFTDELGAAALVGAELLNAAAARGLVVREDVMDPGRRLPLYINRITQAGEDLIARHEGRTAATITPPRRDLTPADAETLYVPRGTWSGLRTLAAQPDADAWIPAAAMDARFDAEDRKFLLSRNLAQVRRPDSGRANEGFLYRATPLGRGAKARDTTSSEVRVQIRVQGLALP